MKLRYFKREFVVNTDPEVDSLYIEAMPSIGRCITKSCQKMSDGVFRVEIEIPEGDLYYNFKDGTSHETIAPGTNYYHGDLKNWLIARWERVIHYRSIFAPTLHFATGFQMSGMKLESSHFKNGSSR